MERIAEALAVTLGEFFAGAGRGEGGLIVRAGERLQLASSWSHGRVEALAPMAAGRRLEPVVITLDPGGRSGKHPAAHAAEDFALVLEGEVSLTLGPDEHVLRQGDAVTIGPQELRRWENRGSSPARVLIVSSRAPGGALR